MILRIRAGVVILLMLTGMQWMHAQWRGPILTPLGPTEGLPTIVNRIVQDSTGYIYIASNVGLYRYDGHSFTFLGHDPLDSNSIAAGEVLNLIVGSDGLIWIAMRFGGLNSFNPKTGVFKHYDLPPTSYKSEPTINGIYEDPNGRIWVGATNFRLYAFDKKTASFSLYIPEFINPETDQSRLSILSITPDPEKEDVLWLSVLGHNASDSGFRSFGLVTFNTSTHQFTDAPLAGQIRHVDQDGIMWAKHWGNFIIRIDPATQCMDTFRHHFIHNGQDLRPLTRDIISFQNKMVIASSLGLMEFRDGKYKTILRQPLDSEFYSLFADHHNNLWIGTNQGVQILNPDDQHIRYFDFDHFGVFNRLFPARLAYDVTADAVYLSHTMHPHPPGYYVIPIDENESGEPRFVSTPFTVEAIAIDAHRHLWIVSSGRLYRKDLTMTSKAVFELVPFDDKPIPGLFYMSTNDNGQLGMIGRREFIWFHPDTMKVRRITLSELPGLSEAESSGNEFNGFSFTKTNKAYLFSNTVHRLDLHTGKIIALKYDSKVNPNAQDIQYINEDALGNVWMSTYVHTGKYHLEKDSLMLIETFGTRHGMISSGATELHIDEQARVWAFTGSGLNAIDPGSGEVRFYGTKEGLPFPFLDPVQVLQLPGNRIATVCHNGLIVYNADNLWRAGAKVDVPVVIKRMRVNGKDISTGQAVNDIQRISLASANRGFDIEFQALAFPTDYKIVYSYRILGMQDEWVSIGENQLITLPAIPPGEFKFQIKAGNPLSDGPVKTLIIDVPTPLYQKPWFVVLIAGGLIAILYAFMRYRIRSIREREEMRTEINKKMAELELKALRSQMNPHFMFNSLNSIKNYILQAKPTLAAEYLSNFAHLIRMILQNSREKAITLQEEMDTLLLYIELEQIRFDKQFEFTCIVDKHIPLEQVMIPPMLLQPFVENAIWHGLMHKREPGQLLLQFSLEGNVIACIIEDDGIGRAKSAELKSLSANKYKSMGMGITQDRIELMNKMDSLGIAVEIIDKMDTNGQSSGTKVIVRVPGPSLN
jgi:streptogramin lyase